MRSSINRTTNAKNSSVFPEALSLQIEPGSHRIDLWPSFLNHFIKTNVVKRTIEISMETGGKWNCSLILHSLRCQQSQYKLRPTSKTNEQRGVSRLSCKSSKRWLTVNITYMFKCGRKSRLETKLGIFVTTTHILMLISFCFLFNRSRVSRQAALHSNTDFDFERHLLAHIIKKCRVRSWKTHNGKTTAFHIQRTFACGATSKLESIQPITCAYASLSCHARFSRRHFG